VNLETFFWCGGGVGVGEAERSVVVLGQVVRIRPRVVGYRWGFGDGSGGTGARVTHTYGHSGSVEVSLTLTWTADYAVGDGGFTPLGATTTTAAPGRTLPVRETEVVSVR
jgi:hypothetical protein